MARTTELGRRHVEYGFEAHHYDYVLDSLMHALTVTFADDLVEALFVAWRRAYLLVAEMLMFDASLTT